MSRVRIPQRSRRAVDDSIQYPGNVNQPDRKFKKWDQYHTFKQTVNHELPDMRHEWQDDSRDEIGFGKPEPWGTEPTIPQVKMAADRAVKLSCLLLGSKVDEAIILRQANEFMALGPKGLERSLIRFAKTQKLYAAENDEAVDESPAAEKAEQDQKPADPIPATASAPAPAPAPVVAAAPVVAPTPVVAAEPAPAVPPVADEKAQAGQELKKEEADTTTASIKRELEGMKASMMEMFRTEVANALKTIKASETLSEKVTVETPTAGATESDKAVTAKVVKAEATPAPADEEKESQEELGEEEKDDANEGTEATASSDEYQLTASTNFSEDNSPKDPRLAACFDDGTPGELPEPMARVSGKKKKEGIKSLPGQPRTASAKGGKNDLESVWADLDAPDINEAFR